jgi:hypothetical protein
MSKDQNGHSQKGTQDRHFSHTVFPQLFYSKVSNPSMRQKLLSIFAVLTLLQELGYYQQTQEIFMITLRRQMILMALAAFVLLPMGSWAQSGSSSGSGAGQDGTQPAGQQQERAQMREQQRRRQEELARRLNFTEDQKQQWVLIQRQTAQQVKAARTDESLNEEQMQEKLKAIHQQNRLQVLAMLTPEQQEELKKWWEEQKAAKQQQEKPGDAKGSSGASSSPNQGKASAKDDDFFAGMEQDPDPAAQRPKKH